MNNTRDYVRTWKKGHWKIIVDKEKKKRIWVSGYWEKIKIKDIWNNLKEIK